MKKLLKSVPLGIWIFVPLTFLMFSTTGAMTSRSPAPTSISFLIKRFKISHTQGTQGKAFTAAVIIEKDDFMTQPQILSMEGLPPGLVFNREKMSIDGVPTQAGTFKVVTKYNDKIRGSEKYGVGGYSTNYTEIVIHEQ